MTGTSAYSPKKRGSRSCLETGTNTCDTGEMYGPRDTCRILGGLRQRAERSETQASERRCSKQTDSGATTGYEAQL